MLLCSFLHLRLCQFVQLVKALYYPDQFPNKKGEGQKILKVLLFHPDKVPTVIYLLAMCFQLNLDHVEVFFHLLNVLYHVNLLIFLFG